MFRPSDFTVYQKPTWCPGNPTCGNFHILATLRTTMAELDLAPHQAIISSGIGCGSKVPDYLKINGFMGIHGRPLAVASGFELANDELVVIAITGDGDGYAIGGNHFIHTMRRNLNITHIAQNNQVYGLTKGQYSPTSEKGYKSKTSPYGAIEPPINPLTLALAANASFVSRTFAGDKEHMLRIFKEAIQHRGYALVDVLQPCIIFNRINTYDWYGARVYDVETEGHDRRNKSTAWELAQDWGDRIPIGVLFQEERPTYEDQEVALQQGSLVKQELKPLSADQVERLKQRFV
ncbi:MAG: 2-oxoacid ferredoxin oxidoreductase [Anaerolineales bacterium]|nr:2-oxoacid ferredoxin oxidoreductase [Anaerolineales bacterium]